MARLLPRVLLVQVRNNPDALAHERRCFERVCGDGARLEFRNLMAEPELSWSDVHRHEALMLGGSGECSATRSYEFTEPLEDVVRRWVQEGRPLLGSCWGHQFLAKALGGEVVTDAATSEVGTFPVELGSAGRRDPLFSDLPGRFLAQMGHHDYVSRLPPGADELARSERCPNQVVRMRDKPVYTTQFHSELGGRDVLERLRFYAVYLDGSTLEQMRRQVRPSPTVRSLVGRFLRLFT